MQTSVNMTVILENVPNGAISPKLRFGNWIGLDLFLSLGVGILLDSTQVLRDRGR
jgi:hypothetical protein